MTAVSMPLLKWKRVERAEVQWRRMTVPLSEAVATKSPSKLSRTHCRGPVCALRTWRADGRVLLFTSDRYCVRGEDQY